MLGLLKISGTTGPTGNRDDKALISKQDFGTSRAQRALPVDSDWSQHNTATGTNFISEKQQLKTPVTSGTSGTSVFQQPRAPDFANLYPAQWYAVLTALKARDPVEWMSAERWRFLISDAESFLQRWGSAAHSLGWTALDLFGVHPAAPAARFDVMGLLPVMNGAAVLTLTDRAATLRARSGAVLTCRRSTERGAVLISEVGP
jgi:hypothetical protein